MPDSQIALKLIYRANIFMVNPTRPALQMGRDDSNDIVIVSLFASRVHARVELRDRQFVLIDLSSNGTFLLLDEESAERRLRQGEMILTGRGWFGLGKSAARHGDHSVRFAVQTEIG
jgi:adenylate cyclase